MWKIACVVVGIAVLNILYCTPRKEFVNHFSKYGTTFLSINEKRVALTIDNAAHNSTFKKLLKILDDNDVKATFLVMSDYINESVEHTIIDAMKNGHEFGNNGKTKCITYLLTMEQLEEEIDDCNNKLKELYEKTDVEPTGLQFYRPSSGLFNKPMLDLVKSKKMKPTMGSVYPRDAYIPYSIINLYFLDYKINSNDVITLHDRFWNVDVLENLLPWLYWHGYTVERLSDFVSAN